MDPAGLPDLRRLTANFLGPARGMVVAPEQVLIVAGRQHGLNLAAHLSIGTRAGGHGGTCHRGAAFLFGIYCDKLPRPLA